MEAKTEKISELSKLLSVKNRMSDDLFHLFGKFGIGHLMNHFALRYMCLLRKYGEAPQSNTTTCFIIDDTVLEKSGVRMEGISRVFDHVKGRCVLGYKLLLCAFFDGKTTIPFDFSLHQEKGKQGDCGRQDSNAERHIIPRGIMVAPILSAFKSVRCLRWKSPWICFAVDGRWGCMRSM